MTIKTEIANSQIKKTLQLVKPLTVALIFSADIIENSHTAL